ncbi:MAG TPA: hypothetical protein VMA73_23870 [Streptosporangiaceae bacterium]|nr:hypothetical protein [Streptosporangiaceae bacterium]
MIPLASSAAAIVLTLGATNAYLSGAAAIAGQLAARPAAASPRSAPKLRLLASIAGAGIVLITLYGLRIVSLDALVAIPTTLFLTVYLGAMVTAARVLPGRVRLAARFAAVAVTVMLGFCGWALAIPAAIALAVGWRARAGERGRVHRGRPGGIVTPRSGEAFGCEDQRTPSGASS